MFLIVMLKNFVVFLIYLAIDVRSYFLLTYRLATLHKPWYYFYNYFYNNF